jgi:signal transduction histidine kinase
MTEKQKIIQQMLEMQKQFIELERNGEFRADEYYDIDGESELAKYKSKFNELAMRLVDLAHEEKGSHR